MDVGADLDTQCCVEVGERFVEQQYGWLGCERSCLGDPLLLPARKGCWHAIAEIF